MALMPPPALIGPEDIIGLFLLLLRHGIIKILEGRNKST
jgi:hypothetical protein